MLTPPPLTHTTTQTRKGELPTAEALCVEPLALSPLTHVMQRLADLTTAAKGEMAAENQAMATLPSAPAPVVGMLEEEELVAVEAGAGSAREHGPSAGRLICAALDSAVTFATRCRSRHG